MNQGVVDLTVPFYEGMPADDLGPKFWVRLSHAASRQIYQYTQNREGRVFLTTDHVGTHLDGPLRFDPAGAAAEQIPLDRVIRPARMLDLRGRGRQFPIGPDVLESVSDGPDAGDAAVLWTGHDLHLNNPDYFYNRPHLTPEGAEWLVDHKAGIVAADFPGIGRPGDDRFVTKRILHRAEALTVEQLCNLEPLEGKNWHLFAAPLRIRGAAGSLLRAVGLVDWRPREVVDLTLDTFREMSALGGAVPTIWTRADHDLTGFFYKGELSYQTTSMFLSEHAGTHLDAPYHFDEQGAAIHELPVEGLLVRARVFDFSHKKALEGIAPEDLEAAVRAGVEPRSGNAFVIWTGHSKNYDRPDFTWHRPFITPEGARWIAARRPAYVLTDLVGLDPPHDPVTPVHMAFLHAGVPFVQVTTNLDRLAEGEWWTACFPLKLGQGHGGAAACDRSPGLSASLREDARLVHPLVMRRTTMSVIRNLAAAAGAAALALSMLSGNASAQESVLDKVKQTGTLKVCFAQGQPDNYKDPKTGEWTGVFVDLVHQLADWMKVEIEPAEVQWNVAVLSLNRGDCDLFGSSLVYNAPRAMQINHIRPMWAKGMNAAIPKDNPREFESPADLDSEDVTLAVIVGSREHETAKRLFPKAV